MNTLEEAIDELNRVIEDRQRYMDALATERKDNTILVDRLTELRNAAEDVVDELCVFGKFMDRRGEYSNCYGPTSVKALAKIVGIKEYNM